MSTEEDSTSYNASDGVKQKHNEEVSAKENNKVVQKNGENTDNMDVDECDNTQVICDNFNPEFFGLLTDPGVIRFDTIDYVECCACDEEINVEQLQSLQIPLICGLLASRTRKMSISLNDINISCC